MADSPNVLLLVVDSLRYDGLFGDQAPPTPNVDRLVEDGVSFTACHSQGISTAPAMTAMLTGRYPLSYGGHWYIEDDQPTFAQQFQRAGYTTCAVHSNPYVSARRNFDRGFDEFREDVVTFEPDRGLERAPEKVLRFASRVARIVSKTPYTPAPAVNDDVLSFVGTASEPWFCWAQYMDVHGPYLGGEATYRKKFRGELLWRKAAVQSPDEISDEEHDELWRNYRREVEYLDQHVGALLDELADRGVLDETLVVLTADHGDEFYEHGRYGHGNLPYAELTHVPLVMRPPEGVTAGTAVVDDLVRCVDILPTAIDIAEVEPTDEMNHRTVGRSLRPAFHGASVGGEVVVTEKRVRGEEAVRIGFRTDEWSFVFDGIDESYELYSLVDDPDEQENVASRNPDVFQEFRSVLDDRLAEIDRTSEGGFVPDVSSDAGVEERLRALGYRD